MIRSLLCALFVFGAAAPAWAHFPFVVPTPDGRSARLVFSETLQPDEDVDIAMLAGAKLTVRSAGGTDAPLALRKAGHAFAIDVPAAEGTRVVHGVADLGVMQRGKGEPHVLTYYPKTILGDAFDPKATLGDAVPVELVPVRAEAAGQTPGVALRLVTRGKPAAAGAEVTVIRPDGEEEIVKVDAAGQTPAFAAPGRYGAAARYFEPTAGERDGKKYAQVRHYATLVVDLPPAAATTQPSTRPAAASTRYGRLPEATSSFGAAVSDGWLYVYGGHTAPTHTYHTSAVSGRFHRVNLAAAEPAWEELPGGPGLQGMNLVAHGGKVYRIGGMRPANKPGDKAENYSIADCARFDPKAGKWEPLPPLPEPRSSHDVVVVGDKLIVAGGWTLNGKQPTTWPKSALVMDLASERLAWKPIEQPFLRRALIAAAHGGKVYVLGGFTDEEVATREVNVLDVASGTWTTATPFPGKDRHGFGPAACTVDGRLYVSAGDGTLYRLAERPGAPAEWQTVAGTTPRIVHRLIGHGNQVLVLGGAIKGANLDLIEAVEVTPPAGTEASSADAAR